MLMLSQKKNKLQDLFHAHQAQDKVAKTNDSSGHVQSIPI